MIKVFKESSIENNQKDFMLAKRIGEIILYLIAAIQLFQEFSDSRYFDQLLIILTITGMIVFICGAAKKEVYSPERTAFECYSGQKEMMEFHNNFIASIFIPMIFLFDTDNVIFTGTSLWNLRSMKLIILMLTFVSMLYYRFLVLFSRKYYERIEKDEEYEDSSPGIKYYNGLLNLSTAGLFIDLALCGLNVWLMWSMEWKNVYFYNVTMDTYTLLTLCVLILFYINDKKRIVLSIALAITIANISYSSYMQFSEVKTYDFAATDYTNFFSLDKEENTYVRVVFRFEKDKNDKGVYKYYLALHQDDGESLKFIEDACVYGNYEATEFKNSFFQWQARDSDVYYEKKKLEKGEKPVSLAFLNEKTICSENTKLKEYIDSQKYTKLDFNDKVTEPIIVGDDYIIFRGNKLEKIDEMYGYVERAFDKLEL